MARTRQSPGDQSGASSELMSASSISVQLPGDKDRLAEPYQVMPPLSDDELGSLRSDIAEHGVLVPVVRDQHGNTIDGHHRARVADELGIKYRIDVLNVSDPNEARSLARSYNLARRHLSREQKRQLIADEIRDNPESSDREIGRVIGCDHKTVGAVRRELSGEIPHPQTIDVDAIAAAIWEVDDHIRAMLACADSLEDAFYVWAYVQVWRDETCKQTGQPVDSRGAELVFGRRLAALEYICEEPIKRRRNLTAEQRVQAYQAYVWQDVAA